MTTCIWCQRSNQPASIEHIIPEAIGCPEGFVLRNGEVCRKCNNGLASLDQALAQEFDILSFMAGVPRKRGRKPKVDSRGNFVAYRTESGPVIAINMDPTPVTTPDGVRVAARGGSSRNIAGTLKKAGNIGEVRFGTTIGTSPLFSRATHKIALGAVAYFFGSEVALNPEFDPVREFVVSGKGNRSIIMISTSDSAYRNTVWRPSPGSDVLCFRLATMDFFVDISPTQTVMPTLVRELKQKKGNKGWTVLPVKEGGS